VVTRNDGSKERRKKPRISNPLRVAVSSVNVAGEAFTLETVLDNLSAGGMYVRLPQRVGIGTKVFSVIHLADARRPDEGRVALSGVALRSDLGFGSCGLAVAFKRHRFL
jgi:c-di-GMP-binding flagellar brake protein YcgR